LTIHSHVESNLPNDIPYIHKMQSMLLCYDLGIKRNNIKHLLVRTL
jgi:hypothetical protein